MISFSFHWFCGFEFLVSALKSLPCFRVIANKFNSSKKHYHPTNEIKGKGWPCSRVKIHLKAAHCNIRTSNITKYQIKLNIKPSKINIDTLIVPYNQCIIYLKSVKKMILCFRKYTIHTISHLFIDKIQLDMASQRKDCSIKYFSQV